MANKLLGVHILTRNEAELLPRCLQSVQGIADEILVIDTGSTDETLTIAASYGARIITAEWQDDFSKARNQGLAEATTDWILTLDADEILLPTTVQTANWLHSEQEAYHIQLIHEVGDDPQQRITYPAVRLFRNRAPYRYTGRVHEDILPAIWHRQPGLHIPLAPWQILHDGYHPNWLQKKSKPERNLKLLQKSLAEQPSNPFHTYNLGVTLCQLQRLPEACDAFQTALHHVPADAPYRPSLIRDLAKVGIALGKQKEIMGLLLEEVERYPDYPDLAHLLGAVQETLHLFPEAIRSYQQAGRAGQELGRNPSVNYLREAGLGSYETFTRLGVLFDSLESLEEAQKAFQGALLMQPGYPAALMGYAATLTKSGFSDEAMVSELWRYVPANQSQPTQLMARILHQTGAFAEALPLFAQLQNPTDADSLRHAECLAQSGQCGSALLLFDTLRGSSEASIRTQAMLSFALCTWSEEQCLPHRFYRDLSLEEQDRFAEIDTRIRAVSAVHVDVDPSMHPLLHQLIQRALELRLLRLSFAMTTCSPLMQQEYPLLLFQHGYLLMAADMLLKQMQTGALTEAGRCALAGVLRSKGHLQQAAILYEQVLDLAPDTKAARIGASLCYMELAKEALLECLQQVPDHPQFRTDLERVEVSRKRLLPLTPQGAWNPVQRRNIHEAADDFLVHDRQK